MRRLTHRTRNLIGRHPQRSGVSLSEVLMSLGLMSIGIAFIAGIFPLAALRTLRATNLTNATILRFNAEAVIAVTTDSLGTRRALIHNPDFDISDLDMDDDGNVDNDADGDGVPDNPIAHLTEHYGRHYIVDPLGYHEVAATAGVRGEFGANAPAAVSYAVPSRFSGGRNSIAAARSMVSLPDTFNDIGEAVANPVVPVPAVGTVTSVDVPADLDLATVSPSDAPYRAVLFNTAQDRSEARLITGVTAAAGGGWTISWADALPFSDVGLVKVEVPKERYTWMLSVRKRPSGHANVDVVVFLNRAFTPESEQVFDAEFRMINLDPSSANGDGAPGAAGVDDDGNGTDDDRTEIGFPGTDDLPNNRVVIRWPDDENSDNDPFLQRGSYIFDTRNSIWYRMQSVESQSTDGTTFTARVVLDEAIKANNTEDLFNFTTIDPGEDANGNGTLDRGGAMTPRGIIAVFPLGLQ